MTKKDLTQFCRETNETHHSVSEKEFRHLWCRRCRNRECRHSNWGEGIWSNRMETQVDRLLDNPKFGDPRQEQFRFLQSIIFEDMKHHAVPIHLSEQNDNWEIPSAEQVRNVLEGKEPLSRSEVGELRVNSANERKEEENEEDVSLNEKEKSEKEKEQITQSETIRPTPTIVHSANTNVEDGGIMIGDVSEDHTVEIDEWSVPPTVANIIPVGGKVVMGKGKKK